MTTANLAFQQAAMSIASKSQPIGITTSFTCAHCGVFAQHEWGVARNLAVRFTTQSLSSREISDQTDVAFAKCQACRRETVWAQGTLVYPALSTAPKPADDMPEEVAADFEEARQVAPKSPRGAAALLRLVIQKLMPVLGSDQPKIDAAIGELVKANRISIDIQQALDTVRVIGNEAVHPGELDLRDDAKTVQSLFGLVNFIVEKGISEPKPIAALYADLPPSKLKGIEDRDRPKD